MAPHAALPAGKPVTTSAICVVCRLRRMNPKPSHAFLLTHLLGRISLGKPRGTPFAAIGMNPLERTIMRFVFLRHFATRRTVIGLSTCVLMGLMAGCKEERQMKVTATAYNSVRWQTDHRPTETACGDTIEPGQRVVAVSRDLFKEGLTCGTEIEIRGLRGSWKVADKMASRHEKTIDVYMGKDIKAARKWGVQDVDIVWYE